MNCDESKKTVLRVAKLNKNALKGTSAHTARKYISENVNTEKTARNAVLIGSSDIKNDVMNYIYKNRTDKKTLRKDAVYAEELVLSASPEFFKDQDITKKWAAKQVDFLRNEYGSNCVSAVLHLDEQTPHIHAFVVPIKDGKLSHKNWNNDRGGKFSYTRLQDRYEAFNKEFFDLTRTKKTALSTATHTELKQYYNTVKKLKEYTQKAFSKTKNNFVVQMPKKFFGLFYKKEDIEQALKAVSRSNAKELIALKNLAEEEQQKTVGMKTQNLKLASENLRLTKYYNNNKTKIEFVNKAFKYNLLEQFKKQIKQQEEIEQAELEKQALLKQQKEQELLQQEQLAQQQQIKLTPPTPTNTKYKKGFTLK